MPNYWGEPISNKILFALNSTWPRFYAFGQHWIGRRDQNGCVLSSTSLLLRYRVYDLLPVEMDHFDGACIGNRANVVLHHYW